MAATAALRRSISSAAERFCIQWTIAPRSGWPGGLSPSPAIWPSYAITPTSVNPARSLIRRASRPASRALWTGDLRVPTCRPGIGRQETSSSKQTRMVGWWAPRAASTRSRWSSESIISVTRPRATSSAASLRRAPWSTVG